MDIFRQPLTFSVRLNSLRRSRSNRPSISANTSIEKPGSSRAASLNKASSPEVVHHGGEVYEVPGLGSAEDSEDLVDGELGSVQ